MNNEFDNMFNNEDSEKDTELNFSETQDKPLEEASSKEDEVQAEEAPFTSFPGFTVTHKVEKKKRVSWGRLILMALVAGCIAGAAFSGVNSLVSRFINPNANIGVTKKVVLSQDEESTVSGKSQTAKIAEECMPSVVAITNRGVEDVMTFFGSYQQESTSSGSGIIIGQNDTELLIVTNYHVVANSKELSVVFSSVESKLEIEAQSDTDKNSVANKEYIPTATVKGYNSYKDLAVIAVPLKDIRKDILSEIKIATIGDSKSLKQGDGVVAIGNSLGYGQSVTSGIVSAVNRKITMRGADGASMVTNSFIQTDAAINSGNSGGALLDMEGRLIGINSVKIAVSGVEGMGYAIPISDVEDIIDELVLKKTRNPVDETKQGFLGITGADVSEEAVSVYSMPAGVFVDSVMDNLAAQKAGIKRGYIITEFDGYTISSMSQLQERLRYYKAGEKVEVKVQIPSGGEYKEKKLTLTLSSRPKE